MPTISVYHHGTTAALGNRPNPSPPKRGNVGGWSPAAARRNVKFLYSVQADSLTEPGFAVTLTLRNCPASHDDWHTLRTAYVKRLRRMGMVRLHWVTEWQRRGVPHLHGAVWFSPKTPRQYIAIHDALTRHWLDLAAQYGAGRRGQHVKPIEDAVGWFQYVAKHAARGANHYQRAADSIPSGWQKTGRMWGYAGSWARDEAMKFDVPRSAHFQYRRLIRAYNVAQARAVADPKDRRRRLWYARRSLKANKRSISEVRGVSGWVPMDVQLLMLAQLSAMGHEIEQTN